ncbi:MAG: hypothetical protein IKL57_02550 [Oscillospiraceae bacterium]|nr:hypothetical protein [Oscillospiraceae bacterium]MBR3610335.1 hypothetical protein [Oscillospiraceae bacterium]MBR3953269.1 hypothetical protein [Oscillospiraceae bacterium]
MILWTPEPFDRIFPADIPETITRDIGGGYLEGRMTPSGFTVSRLVSTDLKKYLKSEYSPGYIRKN